MNERVLPVWVVPTHREVVDLYWVAHGWLRDTGSLWASGIIAALLWAEGGVRFGPVTGRDEQPVTSEVAVAEWFSAVAAVDGPGGGAGDGVEALCAGLGVRFWAPDPVVPRRYAEGVYQTLEWLISVSPSARPVPPKCSAPPLPIPERRADGSTPSADELLTRAFLAYPVLSCLSESQDLSLRQRVAAEAQEHRRLAELIAETERREAQAQSPDTRPGAGGT
jgi:hypothetical protein